MLRPGGYVLVVDDDQLDTRVLADAVSAGATAIEAGRPDVAVGPLTAAATSSDRLLPELHDVPFVRAEADRLEALRHAAFELLQAARIDTGALHAAIADLRGALATDPRAERLWRLLALARYRAGDAAAAIATVHGARTALQDATGLDIGPELRQLEHDLFAQSPALDPAPVAPAAPVAPVAADRGGRSIHPVATARAGTRTGGHHGHGCRRSTIRRPADRVRPHHR